MSPQSQGSPGPELTSVLGWPGCRWRPHVNQKMQLPAFPGLVTKKKGTHTGPHLWTRHVSQKSEGCTGTGNWRGAGGGRGPAAMCQHKILPSKAAGQGSSQRQTPQAGDEVFPCTEAQPVKECGRPHWHREPSTRGRETTVKLAASLLPGRPQS